MIQLDNLHTKFIGKNILHFSVLNSTNDKCKEIYNDIPNGTIIISDIQLKGRGKNSRQWYSPKGGLYMSILLKPKHNIHKDINKLPLITCVAICDTLKSLGIKVHIKWPNDIILNNKKLGGILCESKLKGTNIEYIIIGIGININSVLENDSMSNIFTSLKNEYHSTFKSEKIICGLLNNFEKYLYLLEDNDFNHCLNMYKDYCLILNKQVKLIKDNFEEFVDVIDINPDGTLKVLDSSKQQKNIISGDISIRGTIGYI